MSFGKGLQLEHKITWEMITHKYPWKKLSKSLRYYKKSKHRRERQRIRIDPESPSEYGKYDGWEW